MTTALLVDNPIACMGLRSILESVPKIKVIGQATHVSKALLLVKKLKPQLVFMDIQLSDANNIETIKKILLLNHSIKIIIISTTMHPKRLIEAGAFSYISRNSPVDEITHALHTIAAGKHYLIPKQFISENTDTQDNSIFDVLSLREFQIAQMLIEGHTVQTIAELFFIDTTTIINYRHQILKKLHCHNDVQLVLLAKKSGLLKPNAILFTQES